MEETIISYEDWLKLKEGSIANIEEDSTMNESEFNSLLNRVVEEVSVKKLVITHDFDEPNASKFQVGKYVQINDEEDGTVVFSIVFGWKENGKKKSYLWIEFNKKICMVKHWEKLNKCISTSGVFFSKIKCIRNNKNAGIRFFLKDKCLRYFSDEETDLNVKAEILLRFVEEVLRKLYMLRGFDELYELYDHLGDYVYRIEDDKMIKVPIEEFHGKAYVCKYCGLKRISIIPFTNKSCSKSPSKRHMPILLKK